MWTYVHTDRNNDFLAHAGRRGMRWGKHIFGNAAEEMRQAIARAKASTQTQTNVTSSGRKRNVSGEATGSMERRESVSGGPANPNGPYNRPAPAQAAAPNATPRQSSITSKWSNRPSISNVDTGTHGESRKADRTQEQTNAFNQWNNRSDVAKKAEEIRKRLNLKSRSRVVRHSAAPSVWTYRYTDYNNDYEDFLIHRGHGSTFL